MTPNRKENYLLNILLSACIVILQGCGNTEDSKEHLDKGVEYFEKGEYKKAELELKTSSQSDKNTADTYYYLALLDEKNKNFKVMKENLLKAIELEPNHLEARVKLGNLLLLMGEDEAASKQVEFLSQSFSQNTDVKTLKSSLLLKREKFDDALAIIDDVLKTAPNNSTALSIKSAIYAKQGKTSDAVALLDQAIASDPKNIALHLLRLQFHAKDNNTAAVINDYQSLINEFPKNKDIKILAVNQLLGMGKEVEAEKVLRDFISDTPDDVQAKIMLLEIMLSKHGFGDVVTNQLKQFVEQSSDQPSVLLNLSQWMVNKKHYDEANLLLEKILAKEKGTKLGFAAKTQLANNALAVQDWGRAAQLADELLEENPNYDDAKIVKVKLFFEEKRYDEAIKLLDKLSWSQPKSDQIQLLLGEAYYHQGETEKANAFFEKALEYNPRNLTAFNYVYNKLLQKNDTKYAKALLENTLKAVPGNLVLMEKLVQMNLMAEKWEEAEKVVGSLSAIKTPVAKDLALFYKAEIYRGKKDYQKAIGLYQDLLSKHPENESALLALAASYEQLSKRSESINFLKELLKNNSNNEPAMVLLADLYLADNKTDQSIALLEKLIKSNPKHIQSYLLLAKAKAMQKDTHGVRSILENGIAHNPQDANLPLALASFYEGQGDWESAVLVYEGILTSHPNNNVAINNLASIFTDHFKESDKISRAVELSERFKNDPHPNLRDTYGWALVKAGRVQEGLQILRKVVVDAPDVAIFKYHLAYAYNANGDAGSALSELKQTIEMAKRQNLPDVEKKAELLLKEIDSK